MNHNTYRVVYLLSSGTGRDAAGTEPTEKEFLEEMLAKEQADGRAAKDFLVVTDEEETAVNCAGKGICVIGVRRLAAGSYFKGACCVIETLQSLTPSLQERIYTHFHSLPYTARQDEAHILRESILQDLPAIRKICREENGDYLDIVRDMEDFDGWYRDYIRSAYAWQDYGMMTLLEKRSRKIIGWAGLNPIYEDRNSSREKMAEETSENRASIGIVLDAAYRGKGLGEKCCRWLLAYARELELSGLVIETAKDNMPMQRIAEKLGFERMEDPEETMPAKNRKTGPERCCFRTGL